MISEFKRRHPKKGARQAHSWYLDRDEPSGPQGVGIVVRSQISSFQYAVDAMDKKQKQRLTQSKETIASTT